MRLNARIWWDQLLGALGCLKDLVELALGLGIVLEIHAREFHVAEDGGQDIVEIVGDAAGQGADGLHLLGLDQLLFQLGLAFFGPNLGRDIEEDASQQVPLAVMLDGEFVDHQMAVFPVQADFAGGIDGLAGFQDHVVDFLDIFGDILRPDILVPAPHDLLGILAEHLLDA